MLEGEFSSYNPKETLKGLREAQGAKWIPSHRWITLPQILDESTNRKERVRSGIWEQVIQELLIFAGAGVFLRENIEYRLISPTLALRLL